MHHNAKAIQIIESLVKLARGTLDADGIAELRNQLAPAAAEPVNELATAAAALK